MYRLRVLLLFVLLVGNARAQEGDIGETFEPVDPGNRLTAHDDFLNESGYSGIDSIGADFLDEGSSLDFDPVDALDAVGSFRIRKQIDETIEAKRSRDLRMATECNCVFNLCFNAVRTNDSRTSEEKEVDRMRANEAREQRRGLCWRWLCAGGANAEDNPLFYLIDSLENQCPGGRVDAEGDSDRFSRELRMLEAELGQEHALEDRLREQRRDRRTAEERRRRVAQITAGEAERVEEEEHRRRKIEEAEAERLDRCQAAWKEHRNPCGCGLLGAPAWVQNARTCEK